MTDFYDGPMGGYGAGPSEPTFADRLEAAAERRRKTPPPPRPEPRSAGVLERKTAEIAELRAEVARLSTEVERLRTISTFDQGYDAGYADAIRSHGPSAAPWGAMP